MQLPRAAEGVSPGGPAPEDSFLLDDNRYIADVLYDFRWGCGLELGRVQQSRWGLGETHGTWHSGCCTACRGWPA